MFYTRVIREVFRKLDKLAIDSTAVIPNGYTLDPMLTVAYNPNGSHGESLSRHFEQYFLKPQVSTRIVSDVDKNSWGIGYIYLSVNAGKQDLRLHLRRDELEQNKLIARSTLSPEFELNYIIEGFEKDSHSVTATVPIDYVPYEVLEGWRTRWRRRRL